MTKPPDMLLCIRGIKTGFIDIPEARLRALQPDAVDKLAESMAKDGQLSPIIVSAQGKSAYDDKGRYLLIAGRHRLEAARTRLDARSLKALTPIAASLSRSMKIWSEPSCRRPSRRCA